ncbi:MAG: hypothetical protein OEV94_01775 [Deltaproteobacteria bacterium]|nr:hypothetical protein [Deltaproteobacteria bacterium]
MGDCLLTSLTDSPWELALPLGWDMTQGSLRLEADLRTLSGRLYAQTWAVYRQVRIPLDWMDRADQERLNRWWREGHRMALTLNTSHQASTLTGYLTGDHPPLHSLREPYSDVFQGELTLEAEAEQPLSGRPFRLDDPLLGLLDQTFNALL